MNSITTMIIVDVIRTCQPVMIEYPIISHHQRRRNWL